MSCEYLYIRLTLSSTDGLIVPIWWELCSNYSFFKFLFYCKEFVILSCTVHFRLSDVVSLWFETKGNWNEFPQFLSLRTYRSERGQWQRSGNRVTPTEEWKEPRSRVVGGNIFCSGVWVPNLTLRYVTNDSTVRSSLLLRVCMTYTGRRKYCPETSTH